MVKYGRHLEFLRQRFPKSVYLVDYKGIQHSTDLCTWLFLRGDEVANLMHIVDDVGLESTSRSFLDELVAGIEHEYTITRHKGPDDDGITRRLRVRDRRPEARLRSRRCEPLTAALRGIGQT